MKFKDLLVGHIFEFDHTDLKGSCGAIAHGPWIKLSARRYRPYSEKLWASWGKHAARLYSANVAVRQITAEQAMDGKWYCGK